MQRTYVSGSAKRKKRAEQDAKYQDVLNSTPKLTQFYQPSNTEGASREGESSRESASTDPQASDSLLVADGSDDGDGGACQSPTGTPCGVFPTATAESGAPANGSTCLPGAGSLSGPTGTSTEVGGGFSGGGDFLAKTFTTDPATWPEEKMKDVIAFWTVKGEIPSRNITGENFEGSQRRRGDSDKFRACSKDLFSFKSANGEVVQREWLIYSPSTGNVFCFYCTLFASKLRNNFCKGYSDWEHSARDVRLHEKSKGHLECVREWIGKTSSEGTIDKGLKSELEVRKGYWKNVLLRVVATVKFLCERGLAFRGDVEEVGDSTNGNFLGILELISQFDPFLAKHLEKHANKGSGHVSYLFHIIYDELVILMAEKVERAIVEEMRKAKYFSIVVDSSPDVSHCDQLALILRYVDEETEVQERFLSFLPSVGHTGSAMGKVVLSTLDGKGIDIQDARGQSHDNAANMSGKHEGLQAQLKSVNPLIDYVPCTAHSLNLVGVHAVESSPKASDYFRFVQLLYTFAVASTDRWEKISFGLMSAKSLRSVTLKNLSATRWAARRIATKTVRENYEQIYSNLQKMADDPEEKMATRQEAEAILKKMRKLEIAFMAVLWDKVLERFDKNSAKLQEKSMDLSTGVGLLRSLKDFVFGMREDFAEIEGKARNLASFVDQSYDDEKQSKRKRTRKLAPDECREGEVELTGQHKFRVEEFLPVIDKLTSCLEQRIAAYQFTESKFGFLTSFKSMSPSDLKKAAENLCKAYPNDLDVSFVEEMQQFSSFVQGDETPSAQESLALLRRNKLQSVFPNLEVALRIYLCIPVANCSAERSYSKMSRVKGDDRSSMTNQRLNALSLLTIERTLLRRLSFEDVIDDFAARKARKVDI